MEGLASYLAAVAFAIFCWKIGQGPAVNSTFEQQQNHRTLARWVAVIILICLLFCGQAGLAGLLGLAIGALFMCGVRIL